MQYTTGLVIGRFQPFHKGHAYLLKKALKQASTIVIGIGSSNKDDNDNPFSAAERTAMLRQFLKKEKLTMRVKAIIPLLDNPDDDVWFTNTMKKTGKIDVVFGNNEWVNGIFEGKKIPVVRVGHYKRHLLEGKKIRELIRAKKPWQDRVPNEVIPLADKRI